MVASNSHLSSILLGVGHDQPYQMLHQGPVAQDMLPLGYPLHAVGQIHRHCMHTTATAHVFTVTSTSLP